MIVHATQTLLRGRAAALAGAAILAVTPALAQAPSSTVFLEESGVVVIALESGTEPGAWNESVSTPGFLGEGYIRWDGPNLFNQPGAAGIFGFDFEVTEGGNHIFSLRNRHENPDPTEENDVWIRVDGGQWIKLFSNMPGSVGSWTWESRFDFGHGNQPQASYNLTPGIHRVEFSGRSFGFKMDRLHIYRPGTPGALNEQRDESTRRIGGRYCGMPPNSTGLATALDAFGKRSVAENDVTLRVSQAPPGQFGLFIVSDTEGFTAGIGGTNGNLCIGGEIGRYTTIETIDPGGFVVRSIDLTQIPRASSLAAVQAGETWRWQFWHRDTPAAGDGNLSRGCHILFF